jgi:hypothetical protein
METAPQRAKNVPNEIAREAILQNQISQSIAEAGNTTGESGSKIAWNLAREVITKIWENMKDHAITMEHVESFIEHVLPKSPYKHNAKMFLLARDRRNPGAESAITAEVDRVNQDISGLDWEVHENSNRCDSLQGLNHYLSGALSQTY